MEVKKLINLLTVVLFSTAAVLPISTASDIEDVTVFYTLDYGGLRVEVEGPAIAWPGDEINITVRVQASARIHIDFVSMNISSLKTNREEVPLIGTMSFLNDVDLNPEATNQTSYEVNVPDDALPGLIYGMVWYSWHIKGSVPDPHVMLPKAFPATFIENKPYIELKEEFDDLNSSHCDLLTNYTLLDANYTDLQERFQQLENAQIGESNATGLMYLFLITTGIFVVTTLILMIRRPKPTTW